MQSVEDHQQPNPHARSFQVLPTFYPNARVSHASIAMQDEDNTIMVVGGSNNIGKASADVTYFLGAAGTFKKPPQLQLQRPVTAHSVEILEDGSLYVVGGRDGISGEDLNDVIRMNPITRTWERVDDLIVRRRGHCTAVHNGSIYAFGGYNERSVECFSPSSRTNTKPSSWWYRPNKGWHSIPPMDEVRHGASAVTVGDHIYVLGGYVRGIPSSSMLAFDTIHKVWNQMIHMPIQLAEFAAIAYSRYIIVIGGLRDDYTSMFGGCLIYDIDNEDWWVNDHLHGQMDHHYNTAELTCIQLAEPRYLHTAVLQRNGRVVVIGGRGTWGKATRKVESIHVLQILPPPLFQREIRAANGQGELPIHIGAKYGLGWEQGMGALLHEFPESLVIQNVAGNIPIVLAASRQNVDLTVVYKLFKAMLGFNYVHL